MNLYWSVRAQANLVSILTYIAKDDPAAARKLVDAITDSAERTLSTQPLAGRPGRITNTREWVAHQRYIVVYRVEPERVVVLTVRHTSPRWPKQL